MIVAVVPAYNEETRIGSVLRNLFEHVDHVIVVDDGSKDRTAEVAREAGAITLRHQINRGQGAALETGHQYAQLLGADLILNFDGDNQFDAGDIPLAVEALRRSGAHVLFGSRFLGAKTNLPWFKKYILHPAGKKFERMQGSLPLTDVHNGFRLYTKEALEQITITQDRMAHASEIPLLVQRHGISYIEFPVRVTYHEYGQGSTGALKVLYDLFLGSLLK